ncbi:MAG: SMR family transporter [candidate division Zixibacteria bacterium]
MTLIILMIFVIVLNVCGHVFLKVGMNQVGEIGGRSIGEFAISSIANKFVILGLAGYVSSVGGYIAVLSKTHLSVAYPILMSTGYALVVLASFLFLKEPFGTIKWVGLVLIMLGVLLIGIKN